MIVLVSQLRVIFTVIGVPVVDVVVERQVLLSVVKHWDVVTADVQFTLSTVLHVNGVTVEAVEPFVKVPVSVTTTAFIKVKFWLVVRDSSI